jgi:Short C-terminal domain
MQHGLMVHLALFAASLAIATTVSATETPQLWGEGNDYLRLETVSATNQHPVRLNAEQLTALLGQFYKRDKNKEPVPYFSQDEINRISPQLVRLFAKAKSGEDIDFGTSFRLDGFALVPRVLNAGRLFIENGQLNLLIGMCAKAQDISYQETFGKFRELDHGNRIKPTGNAGCELLAGNGTEQVNNRTDWLRLDISAALTAKRVPVFPSSTPLTFGATTLPAPATIAAPASAPASVAKPESPLTVTAPASEAEERLMLLQRLHDKGLITDSEYEQKRADVLKGI